MCPYMVAHILNLPGFLPLSVSLRALLGLLLYIICISGIFGLADVLWAIASAVCCGPYCAVAAVAWMCQQWMPSLFG